MTAVVGSWFGSSRHRHGYPPRDLAGARDIVSVVDARIRQHVHKRRIGQSAADNALLCAITALGPVPAEPAAREDWQHKASSIGAYRETHGYSHPADPRQVPRALERRAAGYPRGKAGSPGP